MSLRDRQLGGIPLSRSDAFFWTMFGACFVMLMSYFVYVPFIFEPLFGISEEFQIYFSIAGASLYIGQCAGRVEQGTERAQLFFGTYTGVSYSAGIYLLPKIPFPVASLLLGWVFSDNVYTHLGWTLEGDVRVDSIVIPVEAGGVTRDGYRIGLKGILVLEIESVPVYLTQTKNGADRDSLIQAVKEGYAFHVKNRVISVHTALELMQGDNHEDSGTLTAWITHVCDFLPEFGVRLTQNPTADAYIIDPQVQKMFDLQNAQALLIKRAVTAGMSLAEIRKLNPDFDETMLTQVYLSSLGESFGKIDVNVVNLKK